MHSDSDDSSQWTKFWSLCEHRDGDSPGTEACLSTEEGREEIQELEELKTEKALFGRYRNSRETQCITAVCSFPGLADSEHRLVRCSTQSTGLLICIGSTNFTLKHSGSLGVTSQQFSSPPLTTLE